MQKIAGTRNESTKNNKTTALIGKVIGTDGYKTWNRMMAEIVSAQQSKGQTVDVRATVVRA